MRLSKYCKIKKVTPRQVVESISYKSESVTAIERDVSIDTFTVAPISKKLGAGSTLKAGAGFSGKSSSSGKNSSPLVSSGKSGQNNPFASSAKSANSSSSGKSSSGFAYTGKTNTLSLGTSSSPKPSGKSGGLLGFGKSSPPILGGGKPYDSPKSYPSTSSSNPKKSTGFGIIWIPTRRHKKKEYVHVSHNYDGAKDRSPTMYPFEHMSGDSSSHQPFKKKEEDANVLLVPERPKGPIATAASAGGAGVAVASVETQHDHTQSESPDNKQEKHELIKYDGEDKEAAGDMVKEDKDDKSFLENESITSKSDNKWEKGDNVDSVYLRPPPPHKVRSTASSNEEDGCGIKCLYYTLQCCDCVLM